MLDLAYRDPFFGRFTRRRGAPAFAPLSLYSGGYTGNLLDFVTPAGLYADAGTTLAGLGAQVHSIREQVGGGLISQTVSSYRGVREATGVKLDGFDDYYVTQFSAGTESGAFSAFMVADLPATLPSDGLIFGAVVGTNPRFAVYMQASNGRTYLSYSTTQTQIAIGTLGTRVSIAVIRDGPAATGTIRAYVNGTIAATVAPAVSLSSQLVGLGARGDASAAMAIRARGWLNINRALTDDERAKLATYWS